MRRRFSAVDAPGGGGKIQIAPDFVVGRDGDDLLLRNFEGKVYRYPDPGGTLGRGESPAGGRVSKGRIAMRIGVTLRPPGRTTSPWAMARRRRAEFDSEVTIAAICDALDGLGFVAGAYRQRAETGRAVGRGRALGCGLQFLRGLKGISREAQVPALLEAYDIPYVFSDPLTLALTLDKAMCKRVVRDCRRPDGRFRRNRDALRTSPRSSCRSHCFSSLWRKAPARASMRTPRLSTRPR